jgi:phosphoenolpyruvate carboxylase
MVKLLRRYCEAHGEVGARLKRGIHVSINGIAAGLRNRG